MLFSILIANYNNSRYLPSAIRSVLSQDHFNWEIILVDDGSSDGFEEIEKFYEADPRIRIFRNKRNRGCGFTKRRCAELAKGDLMGFLDPDDALTQDALSIMVTAHQRNEEHAIIHSTHYICDANLAVKRIADYPRPLPANTPYLLLNDGRIHAFASFKTKNYRLTEGLSARYQKAVDQDLYYLLEETGAVLFLNTPLYYYRIHGGGISTSGNEGAATLAHYGVIEDACRRRIRKLRKQPDSLSRHWVRQYRTKLRKIQIFHYYRKRNWPMFLLSGLIFPFAGGWPNMKSYLKKLPKEGLQLVRRSFAYDNKITS